jgi:hypothetical protein
LADSVLARENGEMQTAPKAGESYTDPEMVLLILLGGFREHRKWLAKLLGRSEDAILQIYRWAHYSSKERRKFDPKGRHTTLKQIERVTKLIGYRTR